MTDLAAAITRVRRACEAPIHDDLTGATDSVDLIAICAAASRTEQAEREIMQQRELMPCFSDGVPIMQKDWDKAQADSEQLREALKWCSRSADFSEGGQAREAWLRIVFPLLAARIVVEPLARKEKLGLVRISEETSIDAYGADWKSEVSRLLLRLVQHVHSPALGSLDLRDVDLTPIQAAASRAKEKP